MKNITVKFDERMRKMEEAAKKEITDLAVSFIDVSDTRIGLLRPGKCRVLHA